MNGETLTYDEIIERSKKQFVKTGKSGLIVFIVSGVLFFTTILIFARDLALASFLGGFLIVSGFLVYLSEKKYREYGVSNVLEPYKDIINNYNLVFNDFHIIYTKTHLFYYDTFYDTNSWDIYVVCFDDIESITLSKSIFVRKGYSYFKIQFKNEEKYKNKRLVFYCLPDIFIELLKDYIKN